MKAYAFATAVIRFSQTVYVRFEKRSVIINRYRYPRVVRITSPKMSMLAYSKGAFAGNSFSGLFRFQLLIRFFAHVVHNFAVACKFIVNVGQ